MILVDSNVLIALCDRGDELHERAGTDLGSLDDNHLYIPEPVIAEALFALRGSHARQKLRSIMQSWGMGPWVEKDPAALWSRAIEWADRYADHDPDWADAYIVAICGQHRAARVWTYDREFTTIWRRPDGSAIPLAVP